MRALLFSIALAAPATFAQAPAEFDSRAWLDAALAATADTSAWQEGDDAYGANLRLAEQLDDAVGWSLGCAYTPSVPGERPNGWGTVEAYRLRSGDVLVALGCDFGAYSGSGAFLLFLAGEPTAPTLVAFPERADSAWTATTQMYGFSDIRPDGTLLFFQKARGLGDCGTVLTYQLVGSSTELREVRERECDDDTVEQAGDPTAWPVVYSVPAD